MFPTSECPGRNPSLATFLRILASNCLVRPTSTFCLSPPDDTMAKMGTPLVVHSLTPPHASVPQLPVQCARTHLWSLVSSPAINIYWNLLSLLRVFSNESLDPDAGKDWRQEEKGTTEDEKVGWHHQLDGHEFEWTPGVGDGQGGLACCGSWGHKESDTTERLNWTELNWTSNSNSSKQKSLMPLRHNSHQN